MNTSLDSDFYKKFTKIYLLNNFSLFRWKPSCAWQFSKHFHILNTNKKPCKHIKRQQKAQGSQGIRTVDMQAKQQLKHKHNRIRVEISGS